MNSNEPQINVDFAIVGGGVAGSSAAIVLQRAGYATAVIEREREFRDRVRGEACHPWGVRELIELCLLPFMERAGGQPLPKWTRYREQEVELEFTWGDAFPGSPPEYGFNHPRLQDVLLEGARESGARVFRPARADIARGQDGWLLQIEEDDRIESVRASFLIAADGRNSSTRKLWGAEQIADPPHHSFGGLRIRGVNLSGDGAYQGYHEAGFSMLFPQGNDEWRLYYVCPTERAREFTGENRIQMFIEACAATLPEGALVHSEAIGSLAFFANNHIGTSRINGPRAVAIGDAAGAGDPSQGHGMSLVWRDVRVLRNVIQSHGLVDAPAEFARQRRAYEHVLRTHASWVAPLTTDTDDLARALQAQLENARAEDGSALGYAGIFANGPDGLPTDDESRSRFFGEHMTPNPVKIATTLDKYD